MTTPLSIAVVEKNRESALEERQVIDRAKGIVLRAKGISEEGAYALMRKAAMDRCKKLAEVALALVIAAELLN